VINTITPKLKAFESALQKEIDSTLTALGEQLTGMVQKNLRNSGSIASGTLLRTMGPVHSGTWLKVGSPVVYGSYVEIGTKPHWSPIEPLKLWVDLKKLDLVDLYIKTGRTRRLSNKLNPNKPHIHQNRLVSSREAQINAIARRIQIAIARRGIRGRFAMRDALNSLGLKYSIISSGTSMVYSVDLTEYLSRTGFFAKVANRI
jgi:hypothetical protein